MLALDRRPDLRWRGPQRSVGGTVLLLRAACRPRFAAGMPPGPASPHCRRPHSPFRPIPPPARHQINYSWSLMSVEWT